MKTRTRDSIRIGIVTFLVVVFLGTVYSIASQGDICDKAQNPQQCRIDFPDR